MKQTSSLKLLHLNDCIPIAASRSSRNNVFIEWKWNEDYDDKKIDDSAYGSHTLRSNDFNEIYQQKLGYETSKHASRQKLTNISELFVLHKSLPLRPTFINFGPNHLIKAYETENAIPLKAREAIKGSPSF